MIKIFHEGKINSRDADLETQVNQFLQQLKSERRHYELSYQAVSSTYSTGYLIIIVEY